MTDTTAAAEEPVPAAAQPAAGSPRLLVLVTGTGRSGTSTVSGSLHHLGLYVPGPYLGANKSNPKGFFESKWAVQFHKRITHDARINDFDGRPAAFDLAGEAINPELRAELVAWLREQIPGGPQLVVKDPRSVWTQRLWQEASAEAGYDIRYLSMLRHPAEVIGSRANYYASKADEAARRRYETFNTARWVNNSLISERETREMPRTFVPYNDLLEDWRSTLGRVRDELGLTFNSDLAAGERHAVDEFVDPDLRRVRVTWDDLDVPEDLQQVAQGVWDALITLAERRGVDPDASLALDDLGARYRRMFSDATAIAHDAIEEAAETARRKGARQARKKLARQSATTEPERRPDQPVDLEDKPLRDITARQLLKVAGARGVRRLRRG
jgi:hypothetical protein